MAATAAAATAATDAKAREILTFHPSCACWCQLQAFPVLYMAVVRFHGACYPRLHTASSAPHIPRKRIIRQHSAAAEIRGRARRFEMMGQASCLAGVFPARTGTGNGDLGHLRGPGEVWPGAPPGPNRTQNVRAVPRRVGLGITGSVRHPDPLDPRETVTAPCARP